MLSREEVLKIAELAKIELGEAEIEKFRKDLSAILDFVGELGEVTGDFAVGSQIMGLERVEREDKERGLVEEKGQTLTEPAPQKRDDFVAVPEVFKEEEK